MRKEAIESSGLQVFANTEVLDIETEDEPATGLQKVTAVVTDKGRIEADYSLRGLLEGRLDALRISDVALDGSLDDSGLSFGSLWFVGPGDVASFRSLDGCAQCRRGVAEGDGVQLHRRA